MAAKKRYKIAGYYGLTTELAQLFKVTIQTVSHALNGHSNSDQSYKIRQAAINRGAKKIYY